MRITLDAVVSAVAVEVGLDPDNVSSDKTKIYRFINDTRREIASLPYHFKALEIVGELVQSQWVTAGTVKATQDRSEVTGSGTSWASAMSGYYIGIGSVEFQRVAYVTDTTHLTLQTAWQETSVTADSYKLVKRFYELPPKVDKILRIKEPISDSMLAFYEPQEFYERYNVMSTFGEPQVFTQFGSSEMGLDYLTSTVFSAVTSTANSPIIHFANTVFLTTALAPGDRIRLGDSTTATAFYVDSIISSAIVSLKSLVGISNAALSATALSIDRPLLELYPTPNDRKVMYFQATKQLYDLVNSNDFIEPEWYPAIKSGAIAKAMGYINSPKEAQKIQEYEIAKANLIRSQVIAMNPAPRLKPHIPSRYGTSIGSVWGSDRYQR